MKLSIHTFKVTIKTDIIRNRLCFATYLPEYMSVDLLHSNVYLC